MKVLSIDGGGIRAVAAARILVELERLTEARVSDLFDLVAASSTSAVVALALAAPDRHGHPRQSAEEVHRVWLENGQTFAPARQSWPALLRSQVRRWLQPETPVLSVMGTSASPPASRGDRRGRLLQSYLGDIPFGRSRCDLVIPLHDLETGQAILFRSWEVGAHPIPSMGDVARASCALPTETEAVSMVLGSNQRTFAHGGFAANNPSLFAYSTAAKRNDQTGTRGLHLLSLGTSNPSRQLPWVSSRRQHGGFVSTFTDGSSSAQHQILSSIVEGRSDVRYDRFEVALNGCEPEIHSNSRGNLACLDSAAEEAIHQRRQELETIAEALRS